MRGAGGLTVAHHCVHREESRFVWRGTVKRAGFRVPKFTATQSFLWITRFAPTGQTEKIDLQQGTLTYQRAGAVAHTRHEMAEPQEEFEDDEEYEEVSEDDDEYEDSEEGETGECTQGIQQNLKECLGVSECLQSSSSPMRGVDAAWTQSRGLTVLRAFPPMSTAETVSGGPAAAAAAPPSAAAPVTGPKEWIGLPTLPAATQKSLMDILARLRTKVSNRAE